jgi:tetratricopeptide (TPR) repeat protein
VRISAQLIQAPTDTHLWARSYEAELRDILSLQSDVARAIAGEIRLQLAPEQAARLTGAPQVHPEAHEAYLKGLHHMARVSLEDFAKARSHYERAVAVDPSYAPPYAQLGFLYATMAVFGGMSPREAAPLAKAATAKALELDDGLADAHLARACVLRDLDWDFAGAEREFQRTLELNPGHGFARDMYGVLLGVLGRFAEAEAQLRKAQELDPLNLDISNNLGFILYAQRDFDRAIVQYRKTIDLDPSFVMAHRELGMVLSQAGRLEEAVSEAQKAAALSPDPYTLSVLGHVSALAGREAEARKILAELESSAQRSVAAPQHVAYVLLGLGERPAALDRLEAAYAERQPQLIWMGLDATFDPLRTEPRFQELLRRIGLPDAK